MRGQRPNPRSVTNSLLGLRFRFLIRSEGPDPVSTYAQFLHVFVLRVRELGLFPFVELRLSLKVLLLGLELGAVVDGLLIRSEPMVLGVSEFVALIGSNPGFFRLEVTVRCRSMALVHHF